MGNLNCSRLSYRAVETIPLTPSLDALGTPKVLKTLLSDHVKHCPRKLYDLDAFTETVTLALTSLEQQGGLLFRI